MKRNFQDILKKKKQYKKKFVEKEQIREISLLETLNEEQFKSATSKSLNNLVIASAGTGKTSTIIGRVIYLMSKGCKAEEILLLTFTNKAGREMKKRLEKYLEKEEVDKIFAGTFHAYGLKLLKKMKINRKIKKEKEMRKFLSMLLERSEFQRVLNEDSLKGDILFEYVGLYENTKRKNESFKKWLHGKIIDKVTNTQTKEVKERLKGNLEELDTYEDVYNLFVKEKKINGFCDFNDLLKVISFYYSKNKNGLKNIIVDEYQDTNNFQNNILRELASKGSNIFAVGDYDQSIYCFNGSNVGLVKEFSSNYDKVAIHKLNKNYRSSKIICELANNLIENNERIIEKELIPMKEGNFPKPKIIKDETREEHYLRVVEEIEDSPYELNDIAVLFRNNNSGNLIEPMLIERNIPTVRVKNSSFFDGEDIASLISLFKVLSDTDVNIIDYLNIDNFLKMGKSKLKHLCELRDKYENLEKGIFDLMKTEEDRKEELQELLNLAKDCGSIVKPSVIFKLIYETQLYADMFDARVENLSRFASNSDEVVEQLEKKHRLLIKIAEDCETIQKFLLKITFSSKDGDEEMGVNLMTVHASKGLEFKQVFVIDLVEDRFPNQKLAKDGGGIDEERRLFYVALTRAEESLILAHYVKQKKKTVKKSRFINETRLQELV